MASRSLPPSPSSSPPQSCVHGAVSPPSSATTAEQTLSAAASVPSAKSEGKRKLCKFILDDDLALLTEVVAAEDAFSYPHTHECWALIARIVSHTRPRLVGLSARSAKERAERLVKQHKTKENWRIRQ